LIATKLADQSLTHHCTGSVFRFFKIQPVL
jgi:hypothetical protein